MVQFSQTTADGPEYEPGRHELQPTMVESEYCPGSQLTH